MRQRFCRVCRGWHDAEGDWPRECMGHWGNPVARSDTIAIPTFVRDSIEPLWHPADGQYYDSKAKFRAVAKAHNMIEVGNEKQQDTRTRDPVSHDDVCEAIQKLNQGYRPTVEAENSQLA